MVDSFVLAHVNASSRYDRLRTFAQTLRHSHVGLPDRPVRTMTVTRGKHIAFRLSDS